MNIGKALRAGLVPAFWPALARAVVPTIEHASILATIHPATIIDVGANKGQFSSFAATRWPDADIHAFEPLPGPAARYRAIMGDRARLYPCALGAAPARLAMHVASRADSSSLLSLGKSQKDIFHMEEVGTIEVDVRRLDEVFRETPPAAPALLKIDVQGYEYEVIEGLGALRDAVRWVFVETSFIELYEGQRLYHEVNDLLEGLGYRQIAQSDSIDAGGRKVQADVLYSRD